MLVALDLIKRKLAQALEDGGAEDASYVVPGLWLEGEPAAFDRARSPANPGS